VSATTPISIENLFFHKVCFQIQLVHIQQGNDHAIRAAAALDSDSSDSEGEGTAVGLNTSNAVDPC
jgi:hypothetical protein